MSRISFEKKKKDDDELDEFRKKKEKIKIPFLIFLD